MIYGGIDNGVTGSIGIITDEESFFLSTPTKIELNYTKEKQNITRVDCFELKRILRPFSEQGCRFLLERPLTGGYGFKALNSAMRSLEATLITLESLKIPFSYIDSKEWQKKLLPHGIKGTAELKKASLDIASRLYPQHLTLLKKHKDGDGLLIAHYCKLLYNGK